MYLCGDHFITGKYILKNGFEHSLLLAFIPIFLFGDYNSIFIHRFLGRPMRDPSHPDYVPSRFSFIKGDNETDKQKVERFNTLKRRRERMMASSTPENMFQGEASSSTSTGEEMQAEMNNETVSERNFVEAGVQTEEGERLVTQNKISNFSYEALKLKSARFHHYTGSPKNLTCF